MNKNRKPKRRNIFLLCLLAAICIAGVELAACSQFAPEQYEEIVAPVRRAAVATSNFVSETVRRVAAQGAQLAESAAASVSASFSRFREQLEALKQEKEKPLDEESQLASEPSVKSEVVTDPLLTELRVIDGQQVLTGGLTRVVYFNQGDETWASLPYGSDNIGGYGCGPTALAMAVASLTDTDTNPATMAQWAVDHGYWASQHGSYLSIVEGTAAAFGLQSKSFPGRTTDELTSELLNGRMLVALMGPGHFTKGGHFILLRGVTLSGHILVADPNSTERSLIIWDPQIILDELSKSTSDGAPLWSIWLPEE